MPKFVLLPFACSLTMHFGFAEPATTATMYKRHKLERTADSDKASQDAIKSKPEYKTLSKKFGMLHGLSSLANLITVAAAHVHLWNLTSSLFR